MTPESEKLTGHSATVAQLFKDFRGYYGAYVDHVESVVDKSFDVNKQISSFHERLILICIGTLGLSITALTAFIPFRRPHHSPHRFSFFHQSPVTSH
jgi:hypothetical protein